VLVLLLAIGFGILWVKLRHPRPSVESGETGAAADELARNIERSVDADAWKKTGAIEWRFRSHKHLWDKTRNLARVRWDDIEVLLDVHKKRGVVKRGGATLSGKEADKLVDKAYAYFINDSFWLNPVVKFFDDGVTRTKYTVDGQSALMVHYSSGGVTPGDSYLWLLGSDGKPRAWRLWVKVLPIGGIEFSWDDWTKLPTGAWVSQMHRVGTHEGVTIAEVRAAATLGELEADPFGALVGQ
jgi:hypothetical protein